MSDMFDHELDAWESYERGNEDPSDYMQPRRKVKKRDKCKGPDPVHYESQAVPVQYIRVITSTSKAFLFEIEIKGYPTDVWMPKTMCWELDDKEFYVPREFWEEKLKSF